MAPSFFHTCVAAGKTARMEDVERFKVGKRMLRKKTLLVFRVGITPEMAIIPLFVEQTQP